PSVASSQAIASATPDTMSRASSGRIQMLRHPAVSVTTGAPSNLPTPTSGRAYSGARRVLLISRSPSFSWSCACCEWCGVGAAVYVRKTATRRASPRRGRSLLLFLSLFQRLGPIDGVVREGKDLVRVEPYRVAALP